MVDALVAGTDADDAIAVPQKFLPGKLAEDLHADGFGLLAQPLAHLLQRRDVLAVIVERRRRQRRLDLPAFGKKPQLVARHRRFDRRAREPVGQQFGNRARIHHRAGDAVIADLGRFFDDENLELASGGFRQLAEPDRAG